MKEKNSLCNSPTFSPLLIKSILYCSTFVSLDPLLNGFTKTIKTIPLTEDEIHFQEEDEDENEDEEETNDKIPSLKTCATNIISYECKLLKKLNSNLMVTTKNLKNLKNHQHNFD